MLTILREDTKLTVKIKDGILDDGTVYCLTFDCNNKYYAELLQRHLNHKLSDLVRGIRAEEYNRGWKDGRDRKKKLSDKENWFSPVLKILGR